MLTRRPSRPRLDAVSSIPAADDVLDPGEAVYDLPAVATLLGVPVTKVHQQLREGQLVAVRRDGAVVVPKILFDDTGNVVKSLPASSCSTTADTATPRSCAGCSPRTRR